jgi:uncharacterized protein
MPAFRTISAITAMFMGGQRVRTLHDGAGGRGVRVCCAPTSPYVVTMAYSNRWAFALLAYVFAGLAMIGVVVPGIPTFPFLLLAAWAAARGSERLHAWLYGHPRFGQSLRDWERNRAVTRRSKVMALGLLTASWVILYFRVDSAWLLGALALLFITVGTFLATRPEP